MFSGSTGQKSNCFSSLIQSNFENNLGVQNKNISIEMDYHLKKIAPTLKGSVILHVTLIYTNQKHI